MARPALVLDASVGVKWFSSKGEASLPQALALRDGHVRGDSLVIVPDLFYFEVANALVYKKHISVEAIQAVVKDLFDLGLEGLPPGYGLVERSAALARQFAITVYDASYIALAREYACPLVTANPRHQRQDLGCRVIPIEEWPPGPG